MDGIWSFIIILFCTECTVDKRGKGKECDDDDAFLCGNFGVIRAKNIEFLSVETSFFTLYSCCCSCSHTRVSLFWRHRRIPTTNSKYLHFAYLFTHSSSKLLNENSHFSFWFISILKHSKWLKWWQLCGRLNHYFISWSNFLSRNA